MADLESRDEDGGKEKGPVTTEKMDADESDDNLEDTYEVEKIVDMTKSKGKTLYRVRWAGYSPDWDTWEPYDNLADCHHVIDKYLEDKKLATEQEKAAREQAKAPSFDGSDTDSVASSASRKKKSSKPSYVYVEDEECDTLKDKFWRDLEEGKINVFGNDMYSKVKGQGRASRPTSFSDMFRSGADANSERDNSEENSETEKTRKRMRRANSATSSPTSTPGDTKAEGGSPALRHKRAKRQKEKLSEKASEEVETMSEVSTDPTASTSGTTAASRRNQRQNRIKTEIKTEVKTEPHEASSSETVVAEMTPVRIGSGAGRRRSVEYEQDDNKATNGQKKTLVVVEQPPGSSNTGSSGSRKRPLVEDEELEDSPIRERAPIVVIRRSADGNGYTQKLVEGRPRAKSSSSSDERSPHNKSSTERRLLPTHELATMDAMTPTSIKITTRCKANAETPMDTSSSKSRQTKHSTTIPTVAVKEEVVPSSENKTESSSGHQAGTPLSPVSSIRQVWSKKDPKIGTCHIPLYDISGLSAAINEQCHSDSTEPEDNTNNNNTKEDVPMATRGTRGRKMSPTVENIKSLTHAAVTTVMSSRMKEMRGLDSMGREPIPVLRISSSPPSGRCRTDPMCTSSEPVYKIELATTSSVPNSQPVTTCKIEPPSSPSPTHPHGHVITQAQMASALATSAISIPTQSTCSAMVSGNNSSVHTSTIDSIPLRYESESVDSFINSLRSQRESEEIPGFGDIPPLSMRTSLELSSNAQIRTSPNRPLRTTPIKTSNHPPSNSQPLPPIITCQQPMSSTAGLSPGRWSGSDQGMQSQISPLQSAMSPPHMNSPPASLQTQLSPLRQMQQQAQGLPPAAPTNVPFSQPALRALAESLLSTVCGESNDPLSQQPSTSQQHLTMDSYQQQQQIQQQQIQQQQQQHLHQGGFHPPDESPQHHSVCPYPTPSPTQYSSSSIMSPYGPSSADPSGVLSPGPHLKPMSPLSYMSGGTMQPSPMVESPRYGPLEEPCNQFNDVDMRRIVNMSNAPIPPPQLQQMNRPAGNVTGAPVPNRPTTSYNPYSPHQGASPYATSTGSPAAWSMSSPSPGTPGGPVGTSQSLGSTCGNNRLLDDTAFDFDLLEVDPSLWDQKTLSDKNTEQQVEISSLELRNAVKNNDYETVRRALGSGTRYDLEMKDEAGITFLMMAAARSYDDVLELLVLNNANINARSKNGTTTLMFAAENGHRCTVELLLIMGAHMNVQTVTGDTALTKAVRNGNKQIVQLLLDHGANFSSPSYLNDLTAMKVAKQRHQTDITDILNKHISWVAEDFEKQVNITLNNTAAIKCALFPMQCFALSESDHITITFNHELEPTLPGVGVLLFIAHARITSSEVRCRFYGPCAVNAATLNGYQLHPLTEEANFVMSFSPLYNGRNDLEIKTVKAPTSRAKLVLCAYKAQLSLPAD